MVCIACQSDTQVINSRLLKRLNMVWRRRRCILCDTLFTTHEVIDYRRGLVVKMANGDTRPFSADHLFLSLYASLGHRPSPIDDAAGLRDTITAKAAALAENGVLNISTLQGVTLVALERFDKLAARHYAAMHRL